MRAALAQGLICPGCQGAYKLEILERRGECVVEGALHCACPRAAPVIAGVPRILPELSAETLVVRHRAYFDRHTELTPRASGPGLGPSLRTLAAFGDEWERFPELLDIHRSIFAWYFDGPEPVRWLGLRVLDAGCGMGRWLHFAREAGADVVGMDVSPAIDVAAQREGEGTDLVQADLRHPPFPSESFDLVYSLGVLHHLEDPEVGVRALATLVKPGGELRLYVYRTLEGEPWWKRSLFAAVTALRRITTRLPYPVVHAIAWLVASVASVLFLWPRRLLRRWALGDRLTRSFPLVHYADVPFRMVVSEQFDRFVAPIEGRFSRQDVEAWVRGVGFEVVTILPGLGWRAIARRPTRPS